MRLSMIDCKMSMVEVMISDNISKRISMKYQ
jgi:hypothetical protein